MVWFACLRCIAPNSIKHPVVIPFWRGVPFDITDKDKCPGVNETLRYIFGSLKSKSKQTKTLFQLYAKGLYPDSKDQNRFLSSAATTNQYFKKYEPSYKSLWEHLSQVAVKLPGSNPEESKKLAELGINKTTFRVAIIFRQKSAGDGFRVADAAYMNEVLYARPTPLGITVEGTCDDYSKIKGFGSNNSPFFYSGTKWGREMSLYSPLVLDPEAAAIAAADAATDFKKKKFSIMVASVKKSITILEKTLEKMGKLDKDKQNSPIFMFLMKRWTFLLVNSYTDNIDYLIGDTNKRLNELKIDNMHQSSIIQDINESGETGKLVDRQKFNANDNIVINNNFIESLKQYVESRIASVLLMVLIFRYLCLWNNIVTSIVATGTALLVKLNAALRLQASWLLGRRGLGWLRMGGLSK